MKVKPNLPNLFDQYEVDENRVTNALLQTLATSLKLTERFLKEFLPALKTKGAVSIEIFSQKKPQQTGQAEESKSSSTSSVPDGWFILHRKADSPLAVVALEVKIAEETADRKQLHRHSVLANRYGGDQQWVLLITPDDRDPLPEWKPKHGLYTWRRWRDVHRFVRHHLKNYHAKSLEGGLLGKLKEFLEMKDIVGFQGVDFSDGYDELKARKILKALMQEIRPKVLKTYPNLSKRKGNIMDPWDVFAPDSTDKFTEGTHLVVGIDPNHLHILLTIPNNYAKGWRTLRNVMRSQKQLKKLKSLLSDLRQKLPTLSVLFGQRHFKARRIAYDDAYLNIDLDTTDFARKADGKTLVKKYPALFDLFAQAVANCPANINREVNFVAKYHYRDCPETRSEDFKKTVTAALKAFKPLYVFLESQA